MRIENYYQSLRLDESLVEKAGFNPYYRHIQSGLDDAIVIDGQNYINLAANNYLGLANDARVKKAIAVAVEKYGASLCGTPIATGCIDLYARLEKRLAQFVGLEDAILLPSCYQANNGLFTAVAAKDDVILIDHFAHSSLVQGARSVGCKIRPFLHNNLEHLNSILDKTRDFRQVFVVTESVFSTEGSIAPVRALTDLCLRYNAIPVIDDSHGIGVLGEKGDGILAHSGVDDYFGIYTASLGKALANAGGMIAGKKAMIDHLRYYCPHLIYSTALTPGIVAGIDAVLDIMEAEYETISRRMRDYQLTIHQALRANGFDVLAGEAPINSIRAGDPEATLRLAKRFYDCQVLTTPFIYPSVSMQEGRVRLIAGANLKTESLGHVQKAIQSISDFVR
jgi:7-keto-8-aminopelargonate synthetase-like enzyme